MGDKSPKQNKKRKKKSVLRKTHVKQSKQGETTVMDVENQGIGGLPTTTKPSPIIVTPPDITGPDVRIPTKMEVQDIPKPEKGSLASLLMTTGEVGSLLTKEQNTWPSVAKGLKDVFLEYQKGLPNTGDPTRPEEYTADLCTMYYSPQGGHKTQNGRDAKYCKGTEVEDTVDFLEAFMKANGQWDYIEKQDWYKNGDFIIGIDVNYYPDRSGYKATPVFHKDTGGNNLFVNLVFDNPKPIEKTEWFADLEQPSKARKSWQKDLLPDDVLKELDSSREILRLQPEHAQDQPVNGGVTEGVDAYVSWVDDLVWHATPNNLPRIVYTAKAAGNSYSNWDNAAKLKDFAYDSKQFKRGMLGIELLGTIAEAKETRLAEWLAKQGLGPQDLDVALAKRAWQELYSKEVGGKANFLHDATIREKAADWRVTGEYSEATAEDERLAKSKSLKETPLSLSTRRRANSLDPQSIEAVRKANEGVERSFLRTWVRLLPKTSTEAVTSGVVVS